MPQLNQPANPFPTGTPEFVDFEIWKAGIYQFNCAPYLKVQNPPPHELDYLHGFHNKQTLRTLQSFLSAKLSSAVVRVTSIWLDKSPWVYPTEPGANRTRRELADLAVIVRVKQGQHKHISMWLLQAKKLPCAMAPLPSDSSTINEIELLEQAPAFDFLRADKTLIPFDLKKDFGSNASKYKHWSFLAFFEDPALYSSGPGVSKYCNPCAWRWLGKGTPMNYGSFTSDLLSMCTTNPQRGGLVVGNRNSPSEWYRLWSELIRFGATKKRSGFARGNLINTAFLSSWLPPISLAANFEASLFLPLGGSFDTLQDSTFSDKTYRMPIKTTGFSSSGADVVTKHVKDFLGWISEAEDADGTPQNSSELETNNSSGGGNVGAPGENLAGDGDGAGAVRQTLIIDVVGLPE